MVGKPEKFYTVDSPADLTEFLRCLYGPLMITNFSLSCLLYVTNYI